jgi:hypothetical protein
MVVLHYVYLLLKMPGLSGVLTLRGNLKKSYDCNQEAIQYTLTTRVPDASREVLAAAVALSVRAGDPFEKGQQIKLPID